eukprot:1095369-Pleurochrysis_carterae.AAC.2
MHSEQLLPLTYVILCPSAFILKLELRWCYHKLMNTTQFAAAQTNFQEKMKVRRVRYYSTVLLDATGLRIRHRTVVAGAYKVDNQYYCVLWHGRLARERIDRIDRPLGDLLCVANV